MLYFDSDYMEGAHPAILQRLMETNMEHTYGYGKDSYCESAKAKIRTACQCPEAEIYFLVGGTQTNATVIRGFLKPFEGVIAADTGHIGVHEAGAIESGGHKVLTIPHKNGKLEAAAVKHYLERFYQDGSCTHMVQPGMVYISHPTEYGTLYTKEELKALRRVCEEYQLPLFGRCASGLWTLCTGNRRDTCRSGRAVRRVLYWRHKGGRTVWRSRSFPEKEYGSGIFYPDEAAGGGACEGTSAGDSIRYAFYRKSVFENFCACDRDGHEDQGASDGAWVSALYQFPDESAVCRIKCSTAGSAEGSCQL